MARREETGSIPLYEQLLQDPGQMLALYDQGAQEVLDVARFEGYFDAWDPAQLRWPPSRGEAGPIDLPGLRKRGRLITAIYEGVPRRRDGRLAEAYEQFRRATPAYHRANRIYYQVRRQFLAKGAGDAREFLHLYQSLFVDALANGDPFVPDAGEAALQRARIARAPLSHAQAVAEALSTVAVGDDPRWTEVYAYTLDGVTVEAPLRDLLQAVARGTLDYIAAGEFLATRYNTYTNFAWFGSSVWKVITDADLLLYHLDRPGRADRPSLDALRGDLRRAQAMMVEFFQAHRENPDHLKPVSYWYGHQYTYLTRDMIDLTRRLIASANRLVRQVGAGYGVEEVREVTAPPLLVGRVEGRFLEYPHVGKGADLSGWRRAFRGGRWVISSWRMGRRKLRLAGASLDVARRKELAWQDFLAWGAATLRAFDVEVKVCVDPQFFPVAEEIGLGDGQKKVLFLPTHQSLLDHPVMYQVLQSPELLRAVGWERPMPCVILARTRLAGAGPKLKVGPWSITMFGVSAETFDRLLEEVDRFVTLDRSRDAGPTTQRLVQALDRYPGLTYPVGTTVAFDIQSPPLQHALFAVLPQDVVIVPLAFRGIHSLWPKCPKGNLRINPGLVEVVVSPPMPGETTLLPRRRSLRTQVESAALFQAVHLTTLLNPEPSE
ncbi:MAG: hypothetical protein A3F84_16595 [Candidatus Handelsmanbacteria bacterium RIFCSPLOWO2_12_FULL_64_10]|uniref:Uncharacterized protein n=1 Tax=Handelsmanbacteria sp. (strain RIFCSPLOWO2_12_FULL_64_10) TaxID=1817868 RepID=A0A1F6D2V7_HANXR|nr:MAG: hypothetical protein A3F84_16595 [Candidatus Handelsmanbacteria bacterium RIFCSPLOWO2_12_FULL_64_10]